MAASSAPALAEAAGEEHCGNAVDALGADGVFDFLSDGLKRDCVAKRRPCMAEGDSKHFDRRGF